MDKVPKILIARSDQDGVERSFALDLGAACCELPDQRESVPFGRGPQVEVVGRPPVDERLEAAAGETEPGLEGQ